ncbi:methylated-DNA--[protein]-cysteine S-methyltransferase [Paraneptunicella aestuarii]|uniref:methylated-DNA--[protein]-cysteine S-methyltransferase n=1 Tax=Paraneptunicella aestuarii TaxID=2831148 RepID=UPI001E472763|nr:methylated-DNA--[protein]-cysteine S-methyltransferase [Paraneptunicella aestuarii]
MNHTYLSTELGLVKITGNEAAITHIDFVANKDFPETETVVLKQAKAQLQEYFDGSRTEFDLPLSPKGTAFQQKVWEQLQTIPFGKTVSYQDIAKGIGNPRGTQAVGGANGKNPIAIVIPCHRVIGKNGTLTGYAGGLDKKAWLLALEQKHN